MTDISACGLFVDNEMVRLGFLGLFLFVCCGVFFLNTQGKPGYFYLFLFTYLCFRY